MFINGTISFFVSHIKHNTMSANLSAVEVISLSSLVLLVVWISFSFIHQLFSLKEEYFSVSGFVVCFLHTMFDEVLLEAAHRSALSRYSRERKSSVDD